MFQEIGIGKVVILLIWANIIKCELKKKNDKK